MLVLNMLEHLPEQLFFTIATKFLGTEDIAKLSCVSKTLNRWCGNDIWKAMFFTMQATEKDSYIITNKSKHHRDYSCVCYYECKRYKDSQDGGNYMYCDWLDDGKPCYVPNHYDRCTLVSVPGNYDKRPYKNYKKRIATLKRISLSIIPLELQDNTMQKKMQEILNTQENTRTMIKQYRRLLRDKLKWNLKYYSLKYYIEREQRLRKQKRPLGQVSLVV